MSWMDSWSRPTKHAATPPPLFLTPGGEAIPYCHTCGRIIGTRKSQTTKADSSSVKYCSDRCRHNKPSQVPGSIDRRIEETFIALLDGRDPLPNSSRDPITSPEPRAPKSARGSSKKLKGETRITVSCAEIEALVFEAKHDPEKVFGRKKNRARRGAPEPKEWKSVDMEDKDDDSMASVSEPFTASSDDSATNTDMISLRVRPPQPQSEVNGSIGGEKGWAEKTAETPEMQQRRLEGQKRAEERELVRCAARRLCAFGIAVDEDPPQGFEGATKGKKRKGKGKDVISENKDDDGGGGAYAQQRRRKKCEAVMSGNAVEANYAKGEWGIRWRE